MSTYFTLSGSLLRAAAAAGDAAAQAEIDRRAAKAPVTVAALRSRGMTAEAQARITAAKPYKPRQAAVAFTRTKEALKAVPDAPAAAPKRDSLKAVRADMDARFDRIESALTQLADVQARMVEMLTPRKAA